MIIRNLLVSIFAIILFSNFIFAQKQIIINELSQGPNDDWEWIEYLVLQDGTDIRGVYLDDDDTLHGTLGSLELIQLKKDLPEFENVSKGSIIVIYKSTDSTFMNQQDPRLFEAGAPDTDFSDGVIIIPHTNTEFLEEGSWWPIFRANGDDLGIFDSLGTGIFGISYGNGTPSEEFEQGWGMVNLLSIPHHGVAFYTGSFAATAFDSTLWFLAISTAGTPGELNLGQGDVPVELVSFSISYVENKILLEWETATEINNFGFEIERSNDQTVWEKVGFAPGYGNSTENKSYEFSDTKFEYNSTNYYRLKQVDFNGSFELSEVVEINPTLANTFMLEQNYPNPFNPETKIKFTLPETGFVSLKIYTSLGEELRVLHAGILDAGVHTFNFNATDLPSGLYIYKLEDTGNILIRKMMLLK